MKTKLIRNVSVIGICMGLVIILFSSCSKKIYFNTSTVVPAARGYVKIKQDKNKNYAIEVSISDLAEVERLQGSKKTYMVWMISNNESPKNLGRIDSDTKRFSKKLSGSFRGISPTKPARIFITAEEDGAASYPGNFEVLTTGIM